MNTYARTHTHTSTKLLLLCLQRWTNLLEIVCFYNYFPTLLDTKVCQHIQSIKSAQDMSSLIFAAEKTVWRFSVIFHVRQRQVHKDKLKYTQGYTLWHALIQPHLITRILTGSIPATQGQHHLLIRASNGICQFNFHKLNDYRAYPLYQVQHAAFSLLSHVQQAPSCM